MAEGTVDSVADGIERQLDPRWIAVQRIRAVFQTLALAGGSFVGVMALWVDSRNFLLGFVLLPVWAATIGIVAWLMQRWPAVAYRFAWYRLDDNGLEIRRGVYWRTLTSVPRSRVQHTDVSQGPLERRYGLGTLVVHTAGTMHSEVKLPGLDHETARRIRAHLLPGDESDAV